MMENYTLFYCGDGTFRRGSCREEREQLVDVQLGGTVAPAGIRGEGSTVTMTGFTFETSADIALVVPGGTTLVLERGVSTLRIVPAGPDANTAALYSSGDLTITGGEGTLVCDATATSAETTLWSRCICARYGDLTITGGHIVAHCGPCSRNAGAVYAGGRLFGGENEHGAITITGGTVRGMSKPQTIRATNTLLTIGPNSVVENAQEFAGSAEEFHGDCLSMADETSDVVVFFRS